MPNDMVLVPVPPLVDPVRVTTTSQLNDKSSKPGAAVIRVFIGKASFFCNLGSNCQERGL